MKNKLLIIISILLIFSCRHDKLEPESSKDNRSGYELNLSDLNSICLEEGMLAFGSWDCFYNTMVDLEEMISNTQNQEEVVTIPKNQLDNENARGGEEKEENINVLEAK